MTHLKDNTFEEFTKEGVSFVAFWAPWCGPCRMMAPIYEEIDRDLESVKVAKVNVDEEKEIPAQYGIRNIPTMLIMKNGDVVDTVIGASSKESIKDKIKNSYKENFKNIFKVEF